MAAQLIQILRRLTMTASLYKQVSPVSRQNGLFFVPASLAVPAGMSHIGRIELSAKRLGIGARSRRTDDFLPNLDQTGPCLRGFNTDVSERTAI
jgi:hypothetical protein